MANPNDAPITDLNSALSASQGIIDNVKIAPTYTSKLFPDTLRIFANWTITDQNRVYTYTKQVKNQSSTSNTAAAFGSEDMYPWQFTSLGNLDYIEVAPSIKPSGYTTVENQDRASATVCYAVEIVMENKVASQYSKGSQINAEYLGTGAFTMAYNSNTKITGAYDSTAVTKNIYPVTNITNLNVYLQGSLGRNSGGKFQLDITIRYQGYPDDVGQNVFSHIFEDVHVFSFNQTQEQGGISGLITKPSGDPASSMAIGNVQIITPAEEYYYIRNIKGDPRKAILRHFAFGDNTDTYLQGDVNFASLVLDASNKLDYHQYDIKRGAIRYIKAYNKGKNKADNTSLSNTVSIPRDINIAFNLSITFRIFQKLFISRKYYQKDGKIVYDIVFSGNNSIGFPGDKTITTSDFSDLTITVNGTIHWVFDETTTLLSDGTYYTRVSKLTGKMLSNVSNKISMSPDASKSYGLYLKAAMFDKISKSDIVEVTLGSGQDIEKHIDEEVAKQLVSIQTALSDIGLFFTYGLYKPDEAITDTYNEYFMISGYSQSGAGDLILAGLEEFFKKEQGQETPNSEQISAVKKYLEFRSSKIQKTPAVLYGRTINAKKITAWNWSEVSKGGEKSGITVVPSTTV